MYERLEDGGKFKTYTFLEMEETSELLDVLVPTSTSLRTTMVEASKTSPATTGPPAPATKIDTIGCFRLDGEIIGGFKDFLCK